MEQRGQQWLNLVLKHGVAVFTLAVSVVKLELKVLNVLRDTVYLYLRLVHDSFRVLHAHRVNLPHGNFLLE